MTAQQYSAAARAHASTIQGHDHCGDFPDSYCSLMEGFDAALKAAAALHAALEVAASPPVPEPVLLTDPDDPRIKVGALLEITHLLGKDGESITYRHRIEKAGALAWGIDTIRRNLVDRDRPYVLLAEAPDPDADTRQALVEIMTGIGVHDLTTDEATQVIMGLRERGVTL